MSACCATTSCSESPPEAKDQGAAFLWLKLGLAVVISGLNMIFGLGVNATPPEGVAYYIIHSLLAGSVLVVVLLAGKGLMLQAFRQARTLKPGIELLFALGITGAFGASLYSSLTHIGDIYYEVVAILVTIYAVGNTINTFQRSKALSAIQALHHRYATARLEDGSKISTALLEEGQSVIIRPGEGIPVDGVITDGVALVNQTALTGEPFAIVRRKDDPVLAGSDNLDGTLTVLATTSGQTRQLDALINDLSASRLQKSHIQRQADQAAYYFFPVVLIISFITFAIWWHLQTWQVAHFHSLAVIVVACPCALGLATPIALWSTINRLFHLGIITRQADFIERLTQVDTIIFDKTGTLSQLQPALVDFVSHSDTPKNSLQQFIAAAQREFNHPISSLFSRWQPGEPPLRCHAIAGTGIEAVWKDGTVLSLGNDQLIDNQDLERLDELLHQDSPKIEKENLIYIKQNRKLVALASYREKLRDDTPELINQLTNADYKLMLLTGDQLNRAVLLKIPQIDIKAGCSPIEKKKYIEELQSQGSKVLFVGDGINDGPAMNAAFASLAVNEGNEVTVETAQASMKGSQLASLISAIHLARQTMHTLKANLIFAAAYNIIGISLASTGVLNPVWAALLMLISSATVSYRALNSARASIGENRLLQPKHDTPRFIQTPSGAAWLTVAGILSSGMLFALAGNFTPAGWIICLALTGLISALVATRFTKWPADGQEFLLTGCWGFSGMMLGWMALAGWSPVVHEGVCLCGCANSPFGAGMTMLLNPMYYGMVIGSLAAAAIALKMKISTYPLSSHLLCIGMMCVSMWIASILWSFVPIQADAHMQFLLSSAVMTASMLAGMMAWPLLRKLHLKKISPLATA